MPGGGNGALHPKGRRWYRRGFDSPALRTASTVVENACDFKGFGMANVLMRDKQERVIARLVEGASIRSTERMTGVHRDTIMRLATRVGDGCAQLPTLAAGVTDRLWSISDLLNEVA